MHAQKPMMLFNNNGFRPSLSISFDCNLLRLAFYFGYASVDGGFQSKSKVKLMKCERNDAWKQCFGKHFSMNRSERKKKTNATVLFVTFQSVHGIINSNLSFSLSNFHLVLHFSLACLFFSLSQYIRYHFFFRCVTFSPLHLVSRVPIERWLVHTNCVQRLRFMHPHQAIFQFHATLCF